MKMQLAQIGAMVRYEIKMHWRRRALLVVTLALLVISVGFALLMGASLQGVQFTPDVEFDVSLAFIPSSWFGIYVTLVALLPVIVSDTIPKDEHFGVRDLLDSLPLSPGVYMLGKLVGMWVSVTLGLLFVMVMSWVVWLLILGFFNPRAFLETWLIGAVLVMVMNCSMSMLLSAWAKSRRSAISVGVVFTTLCIFLLIVGLNAINAGRDSIDFWFNFSPARPAFFWHFGRLQDMLGADALPAIITGSDLWQTIMFGLLQIMALWIGIWGWIRWRAGLR